MTISRREMIIMMGATAATGLVGGSLHRVNAQETLPAPRIPLDEFVKDASLLALLRKGVRAMAKRKKSDPCSWFYQSAIHGVTFEAVVEAAKEDPDVKNVHPALWNQCPHNKQHSANFLPWHRGYTYYFERILRWHTGDKTFSLPYWNYHSEANRAFPKEFGIIHLEGKQDVPDNSFYYPSPDEKINPLYYPSRDYYFTTYEHWTKPEGGFEPLVQLSDWAVNVELPMASPVFFGATEQDGLGGGIYDADAGTRGLLEMYPHDQIHRMVGGIVITPDGKDYAGAMANPLTAGFDPIFPIHHSNIDRLWAEWSCMTGKDWGPLPPKTWFDEKPWTFFDIDEEGNAVRKNEPRKNYFDHRALQVRFKYEDMSCNPLKLPDWIMAAPAQGPVELLASSELSLATKMPQTLTVNSTEFSVPGIQKTVIRIEDSGRQRLKAPAANFRSKVLTNNLLLSMPVKEKRVFLRLNKIEMASLHGTGFDVHLTDNPSAAFTRNDASFVGSLALFNHIPGQYPNRQNRSVRRGGTMGRMQMAGEHSQSFDVTRAVASIGNKNLEGLSVVFVPYPLMASPTRELLLIGKNAIKVGGIEFFMR